MSCWFGFPPPSRWAEYGLAHLVDLGGNNEPVPADTPIRVAVAVVDLVEPIEEHERVGRG